MRAFRKYVQIFNNKNLYWTNSRKQKNILKLKYFRYYFLEALNCRLNSSNSA